MQLCCLTTKVLVFYPVHMRNTMNCWSMQWWCLTTIVMFTGVWWTAEVCSGGVWLLLSCSQEYDELLKYAVVVSDYHCHVHRSMMNCWSMQWWCLTTIVMFTGVWWTAEVCSGGVWLLLSCSQEYDELLKYAVVVSDYYCHVHRSMMNCWSMQWWCLTTIVMFTGVWWIAEVCSGGARLLAVVLCSQEEYDKLLKYVVPVVVADY